MATSVLSWIPRGGIESNRWGELTSLSLSLFFNNSVVHPVHHGVKCTSTEGTGRIRHSKKPRLSATDTGTGNGLRLRWSGGHAIMWLRCRQDSAGLVARESVEEGIERRAGECGLGSRGSLDRLAASDATRRVGGSVTGPGPNTRGA
jgi:hypothetical protein